MPSVPSHDRSFFRRPSIGPASRLIAPPRPPRRYLSTHYPHSPGDRSRSSSPLHQALTGQTVWCNSSAHVVRRPDRITRVRNKEVGMTSSQKLLRVTTLLGFALVCATVLWPSHALPENAPVTLPIETVANYLHAVIEADRDVYTRHVVERLQTKGVVVASENWEQKNTLPLPAQF